LLMRCGCRFLARLLYLLSYQGAVRRSWPEYLQALSNIRQLYISVGLEENVIVPSAHAVFVNLFSFHTLNQWNKFAQWCLWEERSAILEGPIFIDVPRSRFLGFGIVSLYLNNRSRCLRRPMTLTTSMAFVLIRYLIGIL
jgi:hypothetical protein